jgi:DNA topoisomerase-2
MNSKMFINNFTNNQLKSYAQYDNERSLPNIMDGQKTTQRKILFTASKLSDNELIKCSVLGMRASEQTDYAHGESSIIGAVIGLAQSYPGSNNINLLFGEGQFGSRLSHESASPRYIHVKKSSMFNKIFNKEDENILIDQYDGVDKIEPKFYLPTIPLLLVNGSLGTGNGFKCNIASYSIESIYEFLDEYCKKGKTDKKLVPYVNRFTGKITKSSETGQIVYSGVIKKINTTTLEIHELPPKVEVIDYKNHLNKLVDAKVIKDYNNLSTEERCLIEVECFRETSYLSDEVLLQKFNAISRDTETIVCWTPDGRLKTYDNVEDLLVDWYNYRIEYYAKFKEYKDAKLKEELLHKTNKARFIEYWISKKEVVYGLSNAQLKDLIVVDLGEDFLEFLSLKLSDLCEDTVKSLNESIEKTKKELVINAETKVERLLLNNIRLFLK